MRETFDTHAKSDSRSRRIVRATTLRFIDCLLVDSQDGVDLAFPIECIHDATPTHSAHLLPQTTIGGKSRHRASQAVNKRGTAVGFHQDAALWSDIVGGASPGCRDNW